MRSHTRQRAAAAAIAALTALPLTAAVSNSVPADGRQFDDTAQPQTYETADAWRFPQGTGAAPPRSAPPITLRGNQTVAALWHNLSEPTSHRALPFGGFAVDAAHGTAIAWLAGRDITSGAAATTAPQQPSVARTQIPPLLWRLSGGQSPAPPEASDPDSSKAADDNDSPDAAPESSSSDHAPAGAETREADDSVDAPASAGSDSASGPDDAAAGSADGRAADDTSSSADDAERADIPIVGDDGKIDGPGQDPADIEVREGDPVAAPAPDFPPADEHGLMPGEAEELGLDADAEPNPALPDTPPVDIPGSVSNQWVNAGLDPDTKVWVIAYDYGGSYENGCAALTSAAEHAGFSLSRNECGPNGTQIHGAGPTGDLRISAEPNSGGVLISLTI